MANLKSLAKDTAIYGLSSIVGRFLNYLLVPLYTTKLAAAGGGFGVITNVYAWVALLMVLLTFGMETTFFRFANKAGEDPRRVYSTTLTAVTAVSAVFVLLVLAFLGPIAGFLGYGEHPAYVWTMALTVALDAFQAIPFAYLRYQKRPVKFASLKLLFIVLNIGANLFMFMLYPTLANVTPNAGWAFYINLACTATVTPFFWKELREAVAQGPLFDWCLMKRMLAYSWPILILGIAGILNQAADKMLFPKIYTGADMNTQLGIYGASAKVAMIMALLTQAFRYAYEPIVFAKDKDKDSKAYYAKAMKFFIIFALMAFLAVMAYMGILRHLIGRDYWEGLRVVPIVMAAEIMMGIYFNLSFWYKLIDRTIYGAWFSGAGCAALLAVNVVFVPAHGYVACAWAGFAGYLTAMVLSYVVGQRKNRIDYPLREIAAYTLLAALLFAGIELSNTHLPIVGALAVNTLLLAIFAAYTLREFKTRGMRLDVRHLLRRK